MARDEILLDEQAIEILQSLACGYEHQIKIFPDFVTPANELAQLFSDLEDMHLPKIEKLPSELGKQFTELRRCFDQLQSIGGDIAWSNEALKNSEIWGHIRNAAQVTLEIIGVELATPELKSVTYIPSKL